MCVCMCLPERENQDIRQQLSPGGACCFEYLICGCAKSQANVKLLSGHTTQISLRPSCF